MTVIRGTRLAVAYGAALVGGVSDTAVLMRAGGALSVIDHRLHPDLGQRLRRWLRRRDRLARISAPLASLADYVRDQAAASELEATAAYVAEALARASL